MPTFFEFQSGDETRPRAWAEADASPLLGRFRAVPGPPNRPQNYRRLSQLGLLSQGGRGSVHVGYGAVLGDWFSDGSSDGGDGADGRGRRRWAYGDGDREGGEEALGRLERMGRRFWIWAHDVWVDPTQSAVKKVVGVWYSRWGVLVVLPAALAISWCAIPIPQYPLPDVENPSDPFPTAATYEDPSSSTPTPRHKVPGRGFARVLVNFWFFLFVYYGLYNLTALIWITKVFNLYSLNWWPKTLGFPLTISLLAVVSLAVPIPVYFLPGLRWLTNHNTAWVTWSFVVMALPVVIAFVILMLQERHLGLRNSLGLSETQRVFTSSWWTGDEEASRFPRRGNRGDSADELFDPSFALGVADSATPTQLRRSGTGHHFGRGSGGREGGGLGDGFLSFLPASFVRFVWFCLALFIGLMAYVMGEVYAEMYLRTLRHNNLETIVYVYSWVATIHLLDALTGWILGGNEGERVGSYPLGWVFKLYFMLTYQTYVRALYARLRSPSQFVLLQLISSTLLIVLTPILMSAPFHRVMHFLGFNNQSYQAYQKMQARNVFIRGIAENASMLAFVGSVVVLHFGANKDVYPYFAFDGNEFGGAGAGPGGGGSYGRGNYHNRSNLFGGIFNDYGSYNDDGGRENPGEDVYDFNLTFYASNVTWACELVAQLAVRGLIRLIYKVDVGKEGKLDLAVWPELLPTSVVVMLHVLQNMLFSIIRLQFR